MAGGNEAPQRPGPPPSAGAAVILVEPQLAENIGMAARAMANFGLSDLRLVSPPVGWRRKGARAAASGAVTILDGARLFATARDAIADLNFVLATSARERGQMKRVLDPGAAMAEAARRAVAGEGVGVLFGRERTGLENDEVSLADVLVTFPVEEAHSSLNLAQAVLLVAYEWRRAVGLGQALPFGGAMRSPPASRASLFALFDHLEGALDGLRFYPEDKRAVMVRNMRDILHRMSLTEQDIRTLHGALRALEAGRLRRS